MSAGRAKLLDSKVRFITMDNVSRGYLGSEAGGFSLKSDSTKTPQLAVIVEAVTKVNPNLLLRDTDGEIYTVRYKAANVTLPDDFLKEHRKAEQQNKLKKLIADPQQ